MRKITSLIMSIVMATSVLFICVNAYAAGWLDICKTIEFNVEYSDYSSETDYSDGSFFYDAYRINVPESGKISIHLCSEEKEYFTGSTYSNYYYVYKDSDLSNALFRTGYGYDGYESATGMWFRNIDLSVSKGSYYFVAAFKDYCGFNVYTDPYYITVNYTPNFGNTSISKLTAKKKAFNVKWKKASGATGYEIQYSLNKNMKNSKKNKVKKASSTSKTVKNLKAKKKYYVRIRTYKTVKVNGKNKTYYGKWSAKKTVTTKK